MKEFICTNHQKIIDSCKKLLKNKTLSEEQISIIQNIKDNAKEALKAGQHMENRLYQYRYTIEELGFTRKEKRKNGK